MHVLDMIGFWARERPHHPALIQSDMVVTFKGLADAIAAVSARLARYEFGPGEAVASLIRSPAKQIVVTLALLRRGLTAAPIERGFLPILGGAGIDHLISDGEQQVLSKGRNIRFDDSWMHAGGPSTRPETTPKAQAYGDLIFFSSGSTGLPKKTICTREALVARLRMPTAPNYDSASRVLVMPNISSTYGFGPICELLHTAHSVCLPTGTEAPIPIIRDFSVEGIIASTQQALGLVRQVEARDWVSPIDSLKFVRIGGGLHSAELVRRIKENLCPHVRIHYGSTEAGVIAVAPYDAIAQVPHSVGLVWPGTAIEVVDDSGAALPLGEEGIIKCRTPVYTKSFAANNPGSKQDPNTAWWETGDRGLLTENGVLCITGRSVDVINRGGQKIAATALDELLLSAAGVKDAGVCGTMGPSGIIEIWAGVVPDKAVDFGLVRQNIERQAGSVVPIDAIMAIDRIPRTSLGKIKRAELRDKLVALQKSSTMQ